MSDTISTRIPASCPAPVSQILYYAWHHDLGRLKRLLEAPGRASVREPTTGETPLHAAIRSCAPVNQSALKGRNDGTSTEGSADDSRVADNATAVVNELFRSGAIWNDVDSNNETPGCVAARLGLRPLYMLCVAAGVRAELLFSLLDGYEELESNGSEEMMDGEEEKGQAGVGDSKEPREVGREGTEETNSTRYTNDADAAIQISAAESMVVAVDPGRTFSPPRHVAEPDVNSEDYLRSSLTYSEGKLVDSSRNGVMMSWETSIMRASVDALLPGLPSGRRILNIGFGMGIIDSMFSATLPSKHHIIEAHPSVLEHINSKPDSKFGGEWAKSGPGEGAYQILAGRWQDVVPSLLEQGEIYDAIYFDTFGEDYGQLRMFFTEYVPSLLDEKGVFGFFNGLGADRQICYDVYTQVVGLHLSDAGMDVEWQELGVDMTDLEKEGEGEWQGVKRRYWTLDSESIHD
ncbi:arginine N-methyltransferase 2 [Durotheca rogersii]|uniref:arginine N-methyltransferase 2 n=1 Tax=Durotheca rogersii TaxID=419775 RepID=UPI00221FA8D5|nr:arginine N-methyltransferase 2 [Durotheca rogersii]XP_051367436.1 arginine N-methyltransferase 2 [Durotheca rogersii]KAI5854509.1 arginine N-methyltransferase 2 [Durotheca rogersii]KAI5856653.1 arginine N-methyltransferase 2 [Durotheca rogersii]